MWMSEWYTVGSHRNMMRTKRVDTCKRTHRVHQTCKNTPKQRHTFRNSECEKYHRKQETTHQRGRRRRTAWGLGRWHSHRWNDTNRRRRLSFTLTRTSCVDAVVWVETSPNRLEKKPLINAVMSFWTDVTEREVLRRDEPCDLEWSSPPAWRRRRRKLCPLINGLSASVLS